jgi:16S rRNA G1207 methylase RsmC
VGMVPWGFRSRRATRTRGWSWWIGIYWAGENARSNRLSGVDAYGSLGYRDLRSSGAAYDWILCNVPARIGRPFIEKLLGSGRLRLKSDGELRVVVINDLVATLIELKEQHGWPLTEVARGPRHSIFALPSAHGTVAPDAPDLYLRDQVELQALSLDRPFDLGGDDPKRLKSGLPALIDALPRQFAGRALCFRCGYGQLPLVLRARCPEAQVVAVDRDLLATTFTRRNALKSGLAGQKLEVRESATLPDALSNDDRFDLILGELSPSAGEKVAEAELNAIAQALTPGGQASLLCLEKINKQWVQPFAKKSGLTIYPVLMREGYAVLALKPRTPRS